MALDLGLSPQELEQLRESIAASEEYGSINSEIRAAVLLAVQELSIDAKQSAFEKFKCKIPDDEASKLCMSLIVQYLNSKGLNHTLSVLNEEVPLEILQEGDEIVDELFPEQNDERELLSVALEASSV